MTRKAIFACIIAISIQGFAQEIRFHDETNDTIRINTILEKASKIHSPNERVAAIAQEFLETPYVGATLENDGGNELLTVNLDELDCTSLVENVAALAITAGERRLSWRDFIFCLENIRYRGGHRDGYASRLHYICDWILDNTHRGNFIEATSMSDLSTYEIKTIDFMSVNRNLYPALSDSAQFEKIKSVEIGYRNHRFPLIKVKNAAKASRSFLKNGDIVALTTSKRGLDVSHMGIIVFEGGVPHLLHASSKAGKVIVDKLPFADYISRNRHLTGFRVIRLKE